MCPSGRKLSVTFYPSGKKFGKLVQKSKRELLHKSGGVFAVVWSTSDVTRLHFLLLQKIMELLPSSRQQTTVHRTVVFDISSQFTPPYKNVQPKRAGRFYGASDVTRTRDLLITSEMHYRLCYTSILNPNYYSGFLQKSQQLFLPRLTALQFCTIINLS